MTVKFKAGFVDSTITVADIDEIIALLPDPNAHDIAHDMWGIIEVVRDKLESIRVRLDVAEDSVPRDDEGLDPDE
jgi:hypothetical protein